MKGCISNGKENATQSVCVASCEICRIDGAELATVIRVECLTGKGTQEDPYTAIYKVYTTDNKYIGSI